MKVYVAPYAELSVLATEDVITSSKDTVISYDSISGEYWVGGSSDWWTGNE